MTERSKNYAISIARFLAMLAVVVSHFIQYYGSILAFFFNFSVHMFLFISGYLYSMKKISNVLSFYKGSAKKLMLPYYIYIFIFIGISLLTSRVPMDRQTIFGLLVMNRFTLEVGQFWFLPYILICYGLTPIFQAVLDEFDKYSNTRYVMSIVMLILFVEIIVRNFYSFFAPVWFESYILGMVVCRCQRIKPQLWKHLQVALFCLTVIANGIFFWGAANYSFPPPPIFTEVFYYSHCLLSACIVLFLFRFVPHGQNIPAFCKQILDWSDKYSFDVYIVHNLYIQGNYSLMGITKNRVLCILLICLLTPVSAVLLHKITNLFKAPQLHPHKASLKI